MDTNTILNQVISNLRAAGPKAWDDIAEKTGIPKDTIRKIAYRDRKNPRISTLQPLVRHFEEATQ